MIYVTSGNTYPYLTLLKDMSTKTVIGYNPAFLLKKIDPYQIITQYFAGKYKNIDKFPSKIEKAKSQINVSLIGTNSNSEIFSFKDKFGVTQTMITTNHQPFAYALNQLNSISETSHDNDTSKESNANIIEYTEQLTKIVPYKPNKCLWCRCKFKPDEEPVGIPIKMEKAGHVTIFHVDQPYHCKMECMYSNLKSRQNVRMFNDGIYTDSNSLANIFYRLFTGTLENIKEALDWILHEENGGPLKDEQFHSGNTKYTKTGNIVLLPIKAEYAVGRT